MPKARKTVSVPRGEERLYLSKAEQFLEEAHSALDGSRHDAGMLNAIHAGISAADAVAITLSGRRSADPDHQRAVDLLEEIASGSEAIKARAKQLRMLLAKKNVAEYEARRATEKEAAEAVERTDRILEWARDVIQRARL